MIKNLISLAFQGLAHIKTKIHDWLVRPVCLDKRSNKFGMGFALGGSNVPPCVAEQLGIQDVASKALREEKLQRVKAEIQDGFPPWCGR